MEIPLRPNLFAQRIAFCTALTFSFTPILWASAPVPLTITNFTSSGETSVIRWTAETNSFTNVFFTVQRTTNLASSFIELTNVPENSALVYTDSASATGAAFYRIAQSNAFTPLYQPGAFTAYNASNVSGLKTIGYRGAVFDGHYVYFAPYDDGVTYHGRVLRYDTQMDLMSAGSWSAYDAGNTSGLNTTSYEGGVFDGRYIYFGPADSGNVLRLDTKSGFLTSTNWQAFDASNTSGLNTLGYSGAVFDGHYVYFVPFHNGISYHGQVLRYDTQMDFANMASWSAYDAGNTSGLNTVGYEGGVFDGRYIYFAPYSAGTSGKVLRYDTQSAFSNSASWQAFDAGNTSGLNTMGYAGAVFDGRYIYFVPARDNVSYHGRVLRYDTQSAFSTSSSWQAYDAGNTSGLNTKGYIGGVFDGRYIYFAPIRNDTSVSGNVLRYDTQSAFSNSAGWQAIDAGNTSGLNTKGYAGAVFDGRYIYFTPDYNDLGMSGNVLRFDAKLPRAVPATIRGGSNL
jgi:hypothetical protein